MSNQDYTLYSGAAVGAESCFGENAERYGINEVNYSFDGHQDSRTRGLKVLSADELMTGDVSLTYLGKIMHRTYKDTPLFRNILRSIWHQINSGQQVFVIGVINDDGTVKGGTGWGAEFAKLCNKALYVYDQTQGAWFHWSNTSFEQCEVAPIITSAEFTGTGTRMLEENGQQAIGELFDRSFV